MSYTILKLLSYKDEQQRNPKPLSCEWGIGFQVFSTIMKLVSVLWLKDGVPWVGYRFSISLQSSQNLVYCCPSVLVLGNGMNLYLFNKRFRETSLKSHWLKLTLNQIGMRILFWISKKKKMHRNKIQKLKRVGMPWKISGLAQSSDYPVSLPRVRLSCEIILHVPRETLYVPEHSMCMYLYAHSHILTTVSFVIFTS